MAKDGVVNAIKFAYAVTIAAFLIMAVVFGISSFYEPPQQPDPTEPPETLKRYYEPPPTDNAEYSEWEIEQEVYRAQWDEWNQEYMRVWEDHEKDTKEHRRNIFLIAYPIGLILIVLGLELRLRLDVLKPGFVLGGFGIIIFAISQSELSDIARFVGVALGLIVLIYVGYRTLAEKKRPKSVS